jgi:hypothetical protein
MPATAVMVVVPTVVAPLLTVMVTETLVLTVLPQSNNLYNLQNQLVMNITYKMDA